MKKTIMQRVPEFTHESDERVNILVNVCITKMNRTGKESRKTESGREFQILPKKGMKEYTG